MPMPLFLQTDGKAALGAFEEEDGFVPFGDASRRRGGEGRGGDGGVRKLDFHLSYN
jgi:hypothetical protein